MVIQSIVSIAQSLVSDSLSLLVHIKSSVCCLVDRESFSSCRMAKPSLELTLYSDFLHHNRATVTTRPWAPLC